MYPALISPLMNSSGLISTSALNQDAQAALALSVTTAATVDVLVVDALQASAGAYTGLATTNMTINGLIKSTVTGTKNNAFSNNDASFRVSGVGAVACESVACNTSSIGNLAASSNLHVVGTLADSTNSVGAASQILSSTVSGVAWVDPPAPSSPPNLATVLAVGNNANSLSITNVNNLACSTLTVNSVNYVQPIAASQDYWVCPNGSDAGNGSQIQPFQTIAHAINVCEAFADNIARVVNILAGTYTENLTLTRSRISLVGQGVSGNAGLECCIAGTISIVVGAGPADLNNNNINFSSLLISGEIDDTSASVAHRVTIDKCRLYASSRALWMHPTSDYRCYLTNCVISNSSLSATDPVVEFAGTGMITCAQNQITALGSIQEVLKLSGSVRVQLFTNNILESDSSSSSAGPIMECSTSSTVSIANSAFVYSNSATKANITYQACGLLLSSSGSVVLASNFFTLAGLSASNNAVLNAGAGVIIFGQNYSSSSPAGTSASTIQGTLGTNKFAMTAVI